MTKSNVSMNAKIVRVRIDEKASGLFVATSPDLKGLLAAEQTLADLFDAIPRDIAALYRACGVEVVVTRADDGMDDYQPWVAFPCEVARKALDACAH